MMQQEVRLEELPEMGDGQSNRAEWDFPQPTGEQAAPDEPGAGRRL